MVITKISVQDFRNLGKMQVELQPKVNILSGANAQGKTNFLEAVYLCSLGRSFRTSSERDMINYNKEEAYIQALFKKENRFGVQKLDINLKREKNKGIAMNGVPLKRLGEMFGEFLTVTFSPENMQLIKAGPSERRRFMDMEICQLSPVYYFHLQQYYQVLRQRNNLLKAIPRNRELRDTLFVWDEQLAAFGEKVMADREEFNRKLNMRVEEIHESITDNKEKLEIIYKPNQREGMLEKLNKSHERDVIQGSTCVGIHKDDCQFLINGRDARIYGSQGQQRSIVISLKLAEIDLIYQEKGEMPVLLLDDVLSELDGWRQQFLIKRIKSLQTIITCTGVEQILSGYGDKTEIALFEVKNGIIKENPYS